MELVGVPTAGEHRHMDDVRMIHQCHHRCNSVSGLELQTDVLIEQQA